MFRALRGPDAWRRGLAGACLFLTAALSAGPAAAQNQILAVSPSSAAPGDVLTVTFTLDTDTPAPPPTNIAPSSVALGTLSGSSLAHPSQDTVTATFTIPSDAAAGSLDASAAFTLPTPPGGTLTFEASGAFTVTSGSGSGSAPYEGYNLFAPITGTNTWLLDNDGAVVHSWTSELPPGQSVYLLEDGTLLRPANTGESSFNAGGAGGRLERYAWDGDLLWQWDYSTAAHRQHHDVEALPNGNILLLAWELKTEAEAVAAGRNPALLGDGELWPDSVIEVQPDGTNGATVVWAWHAWDHLVQDYDAAKANYGVVADHPERIDVNYVQDGPNGDGADWTHINAVDYNAELDQIVLSVHNFSEVWIIDHATTTAEAAGHSGGARGKGGDLLYRWGHPEAYGQGTAANRQLYVQHDAEWIATGLPGEGHLLVFNNGQGRADGDYSTVDEIVTPVDASGSYTGAVPYAPSAPAWTYPSTPDTSFFAANISGAQRLPNGDTLVCDGPAGHFFEVTSSGETVWSYTYGSPVFRVERYATDYAGIGGSDGGTGSTAVALGYTVVDTGQSTCYDTNGIITAPSPGESFAGQDAQYAGPAPDYTVSGDGLTVYDENTGLTWVRSPDTERDGDIDAADKFAWAEAQAYPGTLNAEGYGGYTDWRLPSIKELYSLIDFRGRDPSGYSGTDTSGLVPFIDTNAFDFAYGDTAAGERIIDAQFASSTLYVANTANDGGGTLFGVNFADGRIKGYGLTIMGTDKTFYVLCCRGNTACGVNDFTDNGDGTVTDQATGLMWQQGDSGTWMNWEEALAYAEDLDLGGYRDWRLPNAKELQSIVDYTRSPDTTGTAAIDPVFICTAIENEAGATDYPWYWTGTTHGNWAADSGRWAAYVCFGRALGYMNNNWVDVHGAGAQRSDPKFDDGTDYSTGHGPQGDAVRILNFVRCVRGGAEAPSTDTDRDGLSDWYEYDYVTNTTAMVAAEDLDGDGAPNIDEQRAGTIPTLTSSVFRITDFSAGTNGTALGWTSELGRTYTLRCSTNLLTDAFTTVIATGLPATTPRNAYTNTTNLTTVFYRVEVE